MRTVVKEGAKKAAVELAERALTAVADGAVVALRGATGSGRSVALREAARYVSSLGFVPIVLAPPERQLDSAAIAALDLAVGLAANGLTSDREVPLARPETWAKQLKTLRGLLDEPDVASRSLILIDSPERWSVPGARDFESRALDLSQMLLLDSSCPKIVVTTDPGLNVEDEVSLAAPSSVALLNAEWGPLGEAAAGLRAFTDYLQKGSPSEIALGVALATLTTPEFAATVIKGAAATEDLAKTVVQTIAGSRSSRALWNSVLACSLLRRPVPSSWYEFATERLSESDRAILDLCLLDEWGEAEVVLARDVRAAVWRSSEGAFEVRSLAAAAEALADRFDETIQSSIESRDPNAVRLAAEALHLAGRMGRLESTDSDKAYFSDQLNAVGVLALERADRPSAIHAFEAGLEIDMDDAVGRHYLGYSLDIEAKQPIRVEEAYRRALSSEPTHPLWHSRLVSFLIVRARPQDARVDFRRAQAALLADRGTVPLEVFAGLHIPVAANALRRADLTLSASVLDDVPTWARAQLPSYSDQRLRLSALEMSQEFGSFVPAVRAQKEWWKAGPELLGDCDENGSPLQAWIACSIDRIDDSGLSLQAAVVRAGQGPILGSIHLTFDDLDRSCRDKSRIAQIEVGEFLEIGYFGLGSEIGGEPTIRILKPRSWRAGIETPLDPSRYLKRASWH